VRRSTPEVSPSTSTRSSSVVPAIAVLAATGAIVIALVVALRRVQPEPTFEPGLEFNPDFDLTVDEILADIRGESPHA
jgi:hypothetical protein